METVVLHWWGVEQNINVWLINRVDNQNVNWPPKRDSSALNLERQHSNVFYGGQFTFSYQLYSLCRFPALLPGLTISTLIEQTVLCAGGLGLSFIS